MKTWFRRSGALSAAALALVLALVLEAPRVAAPARAEGEADQAELEKSAKDALGALGRAVFLVAAEKGANAPHEMAQGWLPPELEKASAAVAASARTADLRAADDSALRRSLLKNLIDETPEARDALRTLTDGAASRLVRELADLERRAVELETDSAELQKAAKGGRVPSTSAALAGKAPRGATAVLRLARAAPFVREDLKRAADPAARDRTLRRAFDQSPDAGIAHLLDVIPAVAARFPAALAVVGPGELPRFEALLRERFDATSKRLQTAVEAALESARTIREHELKSVVAGARGTDFEEVLKLLGAYKRAFGEAPALSATQLAGLYLDRASSRVYFYLEGEDRWVKGAAHAASPAPVIKFLLDARDPALLSRATSARSLALLYQAFGDTPFETGLAKLDKLAHDVAARVAALDASARKGGASDAQVDAFFARELGYDRHLAGPGDDAGVALGAQTAIESYARAILDDGPEAGAALVRALEATRTRADAVDVLAFTGMKVAAPGPLGTEVALRLEGRLARPPIVALPAHVAPGTPFGCVVALASRESLEDTRIEAEARGPGGEPWTGDLALPEAGARAASGRVEGGTLTLAPGWKLQLDVARGATVRPGEPLRARLRPWTTAKLVARGPGERVELGSWGPDGGLLVPLGLWRAGEWRAVAEDATSRTLAEAPFALASAPAVLCVDAGGVPLRAVAPGASVVARFVQSGSDVTSGKASVALEHEDGGLAAPPVEGAAPNVSLTLLPALAPGRYVVRAKLGDRALPPWPLAVAVEKPRVAFVREPFALEPVDRAGAGEKLYARIDPGFWLDPREIVEVTLGLRGPSGGAAVVLKAPPSWQALPERRLLFPVPLADSAPVGNWEAEVSVATPRGKLTFKSPLKVAAGEDLPFSLKEQVPAGDRREPRDVTALARGESAVVRLGREKVEKVEDGGEASVGSASFVLVGPSGLGHALRAEGDPVAFRVSIPADAPAGKWEVRGVLPGESAIQRHALALEVYTPSRFELAVKGHVGDEVTFDVPALAALKDPVRVRVGSGKWLEQTKGVVHRIDGAAPVPVVVEDARGRRAEGSLRVETLAEPAATEATHAPAAGPTFGVVANVRERSIFYPSFLSLSQALRSGKLDAEWVVLEQGPLAATPLRDLVFERVPYDGPRGANPSSIYRSVRFWERLSEPVKRRFGELEVKPGTVFDVSDTPTPAGEETLAALVRRHVDARGGWVYELEHVGVRAQGATADPKPPMRGNELRFDSFSASFEAHSVSRVVAPGVLGELTLRAHFPERLVLGEPFAIAATTAAVTTALVPDRTYPGELEKIAGRALLATYLEGSLELEGKERTLAIGPLPSLDLRHPGRELVFSAIPFSTDRDTAASGKPRTAERYRVRGQPASRPLELDPPPVFTPVPPGTLENKARRVRVVVRARLAVAVTPGDWPAGRPRPDPEVVGGASFLLDPVDLPRTEIELEAFYSRVSPEGAPPRATSAPALPDVLVTGGDPSTLPALDARPELELATVALATGRADDAEAHARTAVLADPTLSAAWCALGEAMLQERRAEDALVPLDHARELAPDSGRALVVLAEAHLELGHSKEARAAARDAKAKKLTPEESERAARVLGE